MQEEFESLQEYPVQDEQDPGTAGALGPVVVGIGASAGGLEALKLLLPNLPLDHDIAYIVAQHLDPQHRSLLTDLLVPTTDLEVREAIHNEPVASGHIYIAPANKNIVLKKGRIQLTEPSALVRPKPSVDHFFASLAEEMGDRAVGIILSGTGSDGAAGIRAVKAGGGITIVQDPASAKFDGMPRSAIDTGHVDLVLAAERIGQELPSMLRYPRNLNSLSKEPAHESSLQHILRLLRQRSGVDFADYKPSTVERRLGRRMAVHKLGNLGDYLRYLEQSPQEVDELFQDILISVTSFFRDPDAFAALEKALTALLARKKYGDELRIWIPGCASGEEAYTIAILLDRLLGKRLADYNVQIFASDLDESALERGRRGFYPAASLADMERELVERYFVPVEGAYQVRKSIRDLVLFARHNLVRDPPFLRLDLISCRNLLIYFGARLQQRVFPMFHYALNASGLLFLGKAESINGFEDLFAPKNKRWRLFTRSGEDIRPHALAGFLPALERDRQPMLKSRSEPRQTVQDLMYRGMAEALGVAGVVVDERLRLRHVHGDVNAWLRIPMGEADLNLFNMADENLRLDLRGVLHRVQREAQPAWSTPRRVGKGETARELTLSAHPLASGEGPGLYLVLFHARALPTTGEQPEPASLDDPRVAELERELAAAREHLQTTVEELETSNEELQSLNEELQSTNEELQSSNEELQSSNEELQSTNEELTTVNEELLVKTSELSESHAATNNLLASIGYPLLVVDRGLRLVRYTRAAENLFETSSLSLGQVITTLPVHHDLPRLREDLEQVMREGQLVEREVQSGEEVFLQRVLPYRTDRGEISGAVLVLQDETRLRQTEHELREREAVLRALVDNVTYGIVGIAEDGIVEAFNPTAERLFGYEAAEVIGQNVNLLMPEPVRSEHDRYLGDYLAGNAPKVIGKTRHVTGQRKDGGEFPLVLTVNEASANGRRIFVGLVGTVEEI